MKYQAEVSITVLVEFEDNSELSITDQAFEAAENLITDQNTIIDVNVNPEYIKAMKE